MNQTNQMDQQEACARLRQAGFTESEIGQLSRLRRNYAEQEIAQVLADHRRLEFARWLVTTGRLTDQIV
jgi:hypothetical protein